jgi:hypothetical protein
MMDEQWGGTMHAIAVALPSHPNETIRKITAAVVKNSK